MLTIRVWADPGATRCASAIADNVASRLPVSAEQRDATSGIGGGQRAPDERELAPVRFLAGARIQGRRVIIEVGLIALDRVRQLGAYGCQTGGLTEITRQRPYPVAVERQQRAALKVERLRQHR